MAKILLEIIASTAGDCLAAEEGGADRIELCAAIAAGGLTPSLGALIEAKKRECLPLLAMVRPRAGGGGVVERRNHGQVEAHAWQSTACTLRGRA